MEPMYISNTARCPDAGFGILFTWDVRNGELRARVSGADGMEGAAAADAAAESALRAASDWCGSFNLRGKRFDSLTAANRYVERYDAWFSYFRS